MRRPLRRQDGQTAVEFVFVLLFLLVITSALFQALHFELDVFNQSMLARWEFFREAHKDQDTTPCRSFDVAFQGKRLGDLVSFDVPYQTVDQNIRYGPKKYKGERGSKYFDRLEIGGVGAHGSGSWFLILVPDHYEGTANKIDDLFQGLITALAVELPLRGC